MQSLLDEEMAADNVAALEGLQHKARCAIDDTLRLYGMATRPHFDAHLFPHQSLWVDCRVEHTDADHALVYEVLNAQGWQPNVARLSKFTERYDVLRVRHARTNAVLVVIINNKAMA